jgi:YesN/AraC family two-component response regulator
MVKLRILVVDDHSLVRRGLVSSLEGDEWIICGEAENGKDAVVKFATLSPDLVLMDISMPVMNGIEAVREIRKLSRSVKIVMLSMHDSLQIREQAILPDAPADTLPRLTAA